MNSKNDIFFGREDLLSELDALWGKSVSSFVTCRGRRRIGKSTLIKKFAEASGARLIRIEGLRPTEDLVNEDELRSFAEQLALQTGDSGEVPSNWLTAFKRLSLQIGDGRTVVLLDEVSWMAYYDKSYAATLKVAWDTLLKEHRRLVLVVCGSVSVWIKENIVDNSAYFGRRSLDIVVPELPIRDCVRFWEGRADRLPMTEIIDILSITGGVPRYLEEIIPSLTAAENIRRLAFSPKSLLRTDFDEMYADVITKEPKLTARILDALTDGPRTSSEIVAKLGVEKNGRIAAALSQLVESGMVSRDIGKNPVTGAEIRERRYRLSDNYVRFYLKFIRPAVRIIDAGAFRMTRLTQLDGWSGQLGLAFENLIVNHVRELLPHLHLADALVYSAAPYSKRGGKGREGFQIDLLIQARNTQCVVEVKRRRRIGKDIVREVSKKVGALGHAPDMSVRAALVYDGELDDTVTADGYFDAIVSFRKLAGLA